MASLFSHRLEYPLPDGDNGLVCAYALDGKGSGRVLDWPEVEAWQANGGLQWVHLSRRAEGAKRWLAEKSGLDPVVQEALLAEETRPHCDLIGDGVLLILRGVNTNPGADPSDMVSIRLSRSGASSRRATASWSASRACRTPSPRAADPGPPAT